MSQLNIDPESDAPSDHRSGATHWSKKSGTGADDVNSAKNINANTIFTGVLGRPQVKLQKTMCLVQVFDEFSPHNFKSTKTKLCISGICVVFQLAKCTLTSTCLNTGLFLN